jgi:hypothetical protein
MPPAFDTAAKTIHVFVALCDNQYQGIVPVPPRIGNGQDPDNNLYWGCAYGVRTFFRRSAEWKLITARRLDSVRLERVVFKHISADCYLVADAYDGRNIRQCTIDFLRSSSGELADTLHAGPRILGIAGHSQLIAYTGHDGLMDFQLPERYANQDGRMRDVILLACYSKRYFSPYLDGANVNPLVWSTGLMSPEAYTLHDAVSAWLRREPPGAIRSSAAAAYARYQHCSLKAALGLLVQGW